MVLLGASGVGKTAFARIFDGAADSMDSDDCELCGGEEDLITLNLLNDTLYCYLKISKQNYFIFRIYNKPFVYMLKDILNLKKI